MGGFSIPDKKDFAFSKNGGSFTVDVINGKAVNYKDTSDTEKPQYTHYTIDRKTFIKKHREYCKSLENENVLQRN